MDKIKVLIVDDSKLVREIITEVLSKYPAIEVVGQAEDAFAAREMIKRYTPDVITLDVEMPKMDGITFLKNLMRLRPMPVVMLSTLTTKGAEITLDALDIGAVDFIAKPRSNDLLSGLTDFNEALYNKIKFAAGVDLSRLTKSKNISHVEPQFAQTDLRSEIVALGASTGGTEAIRVVLDSMPSDAPPVIITQHIPQSFSSRFARRLNETCPMRVQEVREGMVLAPGNVYVAPGDMHLKIVDVNGRFQCRLDDSAPVNRHKPSVEVMFNSLLTLENVNISAALLTGMGNDGAQSLLELKQRGHFTVIQNEATSMVWGMPGVAHGLGAHCIEAPITGICEALLKKVRSNVARKVNKVDVSL